MIVIVLGQTGLWSTGHLQLERVYRLHGKKTALCIVWCGHGWRWLVKVAVVVEVMLWATESWWLKRPPILRSKQKQGIKKNLGRYFKNVSWGMVPRMRPGIERCLDMYTNNKSKINKNVTLLDWCQEGEGWRIFLSGEILTDITCVILKGAVV